ncbi:RNA-binding S4 domain-containing protein [Dolosicoccus paucivorans]|uniref:RNA-binding S4 domain-containing protein n=1 Tax=Dolosicoccus paucivorans TaxID=84521 RepID=UPI00089084C6|nr:RNA-binding S4 domain-containing protein [Dolosicoccus paucivorans]SDI67330.1 Ribosomal 50S subunit-recycling heat shock protein, contains S4 domain [Dolosicoccus paucivorans]
MRLDKYLKVSRLIKRRTVAKEVADQGRITINGQVAKSSTRVAVGDEMTIQFGHRLLTVRVLSLKEGLRKEEAKEMYEIVKEERIESPRQVDE